MLCALIQNDLVVGVVDLSDDEINLFNPHYEQIVDVSNLMPVPQIGWAFTGSTIVGTNVSKKITRLAMNQRFTTGEMLGLLTYINTNPTSIVALLLQRLQMSTYVDLARSDTQAGIGVLVSLGLLTSDRANTILTTIPMPIEVYQG